MQVRGSSPKYKDKDSLLIPLALEIQERFGDLKATTNVTNELLSLEGAPKPSLDLNTSRNRPNIKVILILMLLLQQIRTSRALSSSREPVKVKVWFKLQPTLPVDPLDPLSHLRALIVVTSPTKTRASLALPKNPLEVPLLRQGALEAGPSVQMGLGGARPSKTLPTTTRRRSSDPLETRRRTMGKSRKRERTWKTSICSTSDLFLVRLNKAVAHLKLLVWRLRIP